MDYYKIGQNIRRIRKERSISQEELANCVNISTTHMSHIETGNTKLSLPVLVDIASVLNARTDDLLGREKTVPVDRSANELLYLLEKCTPQEAQMIVEVVRAMALVIGKYR